MSWRLFVWMSLPWMALWPELRLWLPGDADLGVLVLRALLLAAPLVFATPLGRGQVSIACAAIAVACAGLVGALLLEARVLSTLPECLALLCAWAFSLACLARGSGPELASARALALLILLAPLSWSLTAGGAPWIERLSPWNAAASADGSFASWPALVACALLALLGRGERVLRLRRARGAHA